MKIENLKKICLTIGNIRQKKNNTRQNWLLRSNGQYYSNSSFYFPFLERLIISHCFSQDQEEC